MTMWLIAGSVMVFTFFLYQSETQGEEYCSFLRKLNFDQS